MDGRMDGYRWGRVVGVVAVALWGASGCASLEPAASAKLGQADRAVIEATQSNAGVSAAAELKTAQDKLAGAQAAMAKKDYEEAIRLADQALVDADYARAKASTEKVRKMATEMRQNIQTLRQELDRLPQ